MDRTPALLGVTWGLTGFATVLVCLRFYCRIKYVSEIWWDDFWMAVSLLFSLATAAVWTLYASLGGSHYSPDTIINRVEINKVNWTAQVLVIAAVVTGKIAVAALIARLQAPCLWRSIVLWTTLVVIGLYSLVQVVLFFVQCRPLARVFNDDVPGQCWSRDVIVINGQVVEACWGICDLLLAALPIEMIWKLQMPIRRKISLCCLLSLGVFAFAATVVNAVLFKADLYPGPNRSTVLLYIWNSVQINITIIAGCVPTLVPLMRSWKEHIHEKRVAKLGGPDKSLISMVFHHEHLPQHLTHDTLGSNASSNLSASELLARSGARISLASQGLANPRVAISGTVAHPMHVVGDQSSNSWEISTDSSMRTVPSRQIFITADVDVRSYSSATLRGRL